MHVAQKCAAVLGQRHCGAAAVVRIFFWRVCIGHFEPLSHFQAQFVCYTDASRKPAFDCIDEDAGQVYGHDSARVAGGRRLDKRFLADLFGSRCVEPKFGKCMGEYPAGHESSRKSEGSVRMLLDASKTPITGNLN